MNADDPILAARSVSALMQALNVVYGWTLPVTMPKGTSLTALWATAITVVKDPASGVLYVASGTTTYPVVTILEGMVDARVLSSGGLLLPSPRAPPRAPIRSSATASTGASSKASTKHQERRQDQQHPHPHPQRFIKENTQ